MKTEYKTDLKKNYLVVEPEEEIDSEEYDVRMMEQNQIQGFLPLQVRRLDGSCYLYYEITSMQQLELAYGKRQLQSSDIRHIFSEVRDILESARKYLLRPGQILLDPQYMYMKTETERIEVCYLPVKESSFSVLPLAEFILKKLNHEDTEAVSLGYDFYQRATQPNFSLSDTLHEMLTGSYRENKENKSTAARQVQDEYGEKEYEENHEEKDLYGMMYKDTDGQDFYEVYHKERRGKGKKENRLFQAVHPLILLLTVLLSALLGVLLYLQRLGFTEAGGLFFILLSISILADRFWKNQRKKRERNEKRDRMQPSEWEKESLGEDPYLEEMQRLRAELYGNAQREERQTETKRERDDRIQIRTRGTEDGKIQIRTGNAEDDEGGRIKGEYAKEYDSEERTQYLGGTEKSAELSLISEYPEKYPQIFIGNQILIVGKKKDQADIILDEAAISRIHARLEYRRGRYYVTDLDSRNGTYLNGIRLAPRELRELKDGDRVAFANINYRAAAENESEMTQLLR